MIVLLIIFGFFFLMARFGQPLLLWYIRRQVKKRFAQAEAAQRRAQEAYEKGRPAGWSSSPTPKRKIFDKSDGEYVKFQEIEVERQASATDSTAKIEVESQIVDAEWEEVG